MKCFSTTLIFPSSKKSEYNLYEDDGESYEFKNGSYSLIKIESQINSDKISINLEKTQTGFDSKLKKYLLKVVNVESNKSVTVNGKTIKEVVQQNGLNKFDEVYFRDKNENILFVKIKTSEKVSVEIE